jgi:hypothetical protein
VVDSGRFILIALKSDGAVKLLRSMARPSAPLGPRADLEFAPMFYRDDDGLYFLVVICSGLCSAEMPSGRRDT